MNKEKLINNFYRNYYNMAKLSKKLSTDFLKSLSLTLISLLNAKDYLNEIEHYTIYNTLLMARLILKKCDSYYAKSYFSSLKSISDSYETLKSIAIIERYSTRHC